MGILRVLLPAGRPRNCRGGLFAVLKRFSFQPINQVVHAECAASPDAAGGSRCHLSGAERSLFQKCKSGACTRAHAVVMQNLEPAFGSSDGFDPLWGLSKHPLIVVVGVRRLAPFRIHRSKQPFGVSRLISNRCFVGIGTARTPTLSRIRS